MRDDAVMLPRVAIRPAAGLRRGARLATRLAAGLGPRLLLAAALAALPATAGAEPAPERFAALFPAPVGPAPEAFGPPGPSDPAFAEPARPGPGPDLPPPEAAAPGADPANAPAATSRLALSLETLLAVVPAEGSTAAKKRRAAVAEFYRERDYAPAWIVDGRFGTAARAVATVIAAAGDEGLDPAAFAMPRLGAGDIAVPSDWARAELDLKLSLAVLAYAEAASGGRVAPRAISPLITRTPGKIDPIAALQDVQAAADPAAALAAFNPPHEDYRRLKAKLAEVRARPVAVRPAPIPDGKTLKPGMRDDRVALLRARLGVSGVAVDADVYDNDLAAAMRDYQRGAGLSDDAIVGPRTIAMLNGEGRDEAGEIVANMEMWRWMPRDLGTDHIFVNVPEFMVRIRRGGTVVHEARVVVGTVKNQTPVFSDSMSFMVVNPYWNVPHSIASKEMLPEIKANPAGYFARRGYEVVANGKVVDPSRIIWDENAIRAVRIRQPPGERNALGHIKFMFPNEHAVYLHDTPSRDLFERNYRAYSHGCVRVHEPFAFAEAIVAGEPSLTVDQVKALVGGRERRLDLENHLAVHLAYFTAWVDDTGVLQVRDDLYGHTTKVKKALGM
ncbi:L,D-transpeptidase family protein [Methylobrevis albus]|uniref:L,D-transpeptidase family protein n=1 Tax=Methylobrevis albus TaxID=2793297 RepID=A0A931MXP5_9HYPH|nr:L,D-transpeptidase family protein [Methylobrevis albus]MBH0239438.1 L,D-transpeptidase family protein [Methylobrevis albus]